MTLTEFALLGHWKSQPSIGWRGAAGRQSLHVLHRCAECRYGKTCLVLSAFSARRPRLDAVQTPVLFDAEFKGKQRKLLAQASRNGFFFVLDRTNGEHLLTAPFIDQTWSSGIDSRGRPIAKPEATPSPDGALVEPGSDGSTNWMAPSFDPQTGLFYVSAQSRDIFAPLTQLPVPRCSKGRYENLRPARSRRIAPFVDRNSAPSNLSIHLNRAPTSAPSGLGVASGLAIWPATRVDAGRPCLINERAQ